MKFYVYVFYIKKGFDVVNLITIPTYLHKTETKSIWAMFHHDNINLLKTQSDFHLWLWWFRIKEKHKHRYRIAQIQNKKPRYIFGLIDILRTSDVKFKAILINKMKIIIWVLC